MQLRNGKSVAIKVNKQIKYKTKGLSKACPKGISKTCPNKEIPTQMRLRSGKTVVKSVINKPVVNKHVVNKHVVNKPIDKPIDKPIIEVNDDCNKNKDWIIAKIEAYINLIVKQRKNNTKTWNMTKNYAYSSHYIIMRKAYENEYRLWIEMSHYINEYLNPNLFANFESLFDNIVKTLIHLYSKNIEAIDPIIDLYKYNLCFNIAKIDMENTLAFLKTFETH